MKCGNFFLSHLLPPDRLHAGPSRLDAITAKPFVLITMSRLASSQGYKRSINQTSLKVPATQRMSTQKSWSSPPDYTPN